MTRRAWLGRAEVRTVCGLLDEVRRATTADAALEALAVVQGRLHLVRLRLVAAVEAEQDTD